MSFNCEFERENRRGVDDIPGLSSELGAFSFLEAVLPAYIGAYTEEDGV